MIEIFFHYKISKAVPKKTVDKNKGKETTEMFESFTMPALYGFITYPRTEQIMRHIMEYPQVKLIMQKADITHKDIPLQNIQSDLLAKSSLEVAQVFKGKFVTTMDVFIAYLFLIEKDARILFAKQLKTEDLYNMLYWTRLEHPEEETPKKLRVRFEGGGIGETLISGWTPEAKKYTSDFTARSLHEEPKLRGRENEFKNMLEGLDKVEKNNVLLIGDIGSGKENLVKAFAYHSFEGNIGGYLNYKRVLELMVGSFTAGATNRGDLEERLQEIIAEVSHANDVVLYIPEFQNITGASSYNLDLSGALMPYMQSGNMPIIATITTGAYKTFFEHNPLKESFTIVELKEPEKNAAIQMVLGKTQEVEKKNHVILSYRAIASSVDLADRYIQDEVLPGSAVSLLEDVSNKVAHSTEPFFENTHKRIVLEEHVVKHVEGIAHVSIATPDKEEVNILLHLEDKLHERISAQDDAVNAVAEAMRRVRSGIEVGQRPISFLFLGPTGVGKTETAKALADFYYHGQKNMIRLDMSEYNDEVGIKRLLGAAPGEGNERGELTDKIKDNPASLVLLDEFEKANPKILDLFLQVLDDGRLTDNKGNTVSFRDAIIIATSNAGSEFIREEVEKGTPIDKAFQQKLLEYLQSNHLFKPELLNRFDGVITFKPLGSAQIRQVIRIMLQSVVKALEEQDIKVIFDDAVIEKIVQEGFDKEFGARPLRRYIQDNIEDIIAKEKLAQKLQRGQTIEFSVDGTYAITVSVVTPQSTNLNQPIINKQS
jgi:ATP-dependent Clp protease ATP-binding subunit ClpC